MFSSIQSVFVITSLSLYWCTKVDANSGCDPYFITHPAEVTVYQGKQTHLSCKAASGCPELRIRQRVYWTLNDQTIEDTTRRHIVQIGDALKIERADIKLDAGIFKCVVINKGIDEHPVASWPAEVEIRWLDDHSKVELNNPEKKSLISIGSKVKLACQIKSHELAVAELSVQWYHNGLLISPDLQIYKDRGYDYTKKYVQSPCGFAVSDDNREQDTHSYVCSSNTNNNLTNLFMLTILNVTENEYGTYGCMVKYGDIESISNDSFVLANFGDESINNEQYKTYYLADPHGSTALRCPTITNNVNWQWSNGSSLSTVNSEIAIKQSDNSLLLTNPTEQDGGWYVCSGATNRTRFAVYVQIPFLNDFPTPDQSVVIGGLEPRVIDNDYVIGSGLDFMISCTPLFGYPAPTAYWLFNDDHLSDGSYSMDNDEQTKFKINGFQLTIENVVSPIYRENNGFTCVVKNVANKFNKQFTLRVINKPYFIQPISNIDKIEGDRDVLFGCGYRFEDSEYMKYVQFVWLVNETILDINPNYATLDDATGTLTILRAHMSNQGRYECRCIVEGYKDEFIPDSFTTFTVDEKFRLYSQIPLNVTVELGSSQQFNCTIGTSKGIVKPIWKYHTDGTVLPDSTNELFSRNHVQVKDNTLFLKNIKTGHAGQYLCISKNRRQIKEQIVYIAVMERPVIKVLPGNITIREGSRAMLDCRVISNRKNDVISPKIEVVWYQDGKELEFSREGDVSIFKNHTIVFRKAKKEYAGRYKCKMSAPVMYNAHPVEDELVFCVMDSDNKTSCGTSKSFPNDPYGDSGGGVGEDAGSHSGVGVKTIGIACAAAAVYLLLVIVLWLSCRTKIRNLCKSKTQKEQEDADEVEQIPLEVVAEMQATGTDPLLVHVNPPPMIPYNTISVPTHSPGGIYSQIDQPTHSPSRATPMDFERSQLKYSGLLGTGVYGDVMLMYAEGLDVHKPSQPMLVVVKSLVNRDENVQHAFYEEIHLFSKVNSQNVVRLFGLCRDVDPLYMLLEYLEWGNMKHYLQASRHHVPPSEAGIASHYPPPLDGAQIIDIAFQVALGMQAISAQRLNHRDVAARNVLLSPDFQAKVTSLSLSADAFVNEYYVYRHLVLPLRWISPEALFDDDWSMKSDVWSFGVFMWELFGQGELPYQTMSNDEVIEGLKASTLTIESPYFGDPSDDITPILVELFDLATSCTNYDVRLRPTFDHCVTLLTKLQSECYEQVN